MSSRLPVFPKAILRAAVSGLALFVAVPLVAQQPAPAAPVAAPAEGREHIVKTGDTLWDLARTYLSNPYAWPCLYEANRSTLRGGSPNRIYPAERLGIPAVCTTPLADGPPPPDGAPAPVAVVTASREDRTSFYVAPEHRAEEVVDVRYLPRVADLEYYGAAWLGDMNALPINGRLLRVVAPNRPADKLPELAHPRDKMYVEYLGTSRPIPGDRLLVVEGERVVEGWGTLIVPSAILHVDSVASDVMRVEIMQQFGQVRPGFYTIPLPPVPTQALGSLAEVADGPVGAVIEFAVDQSLYGVSDVVFVSLGRPAGVELGDELLAFAPRRGGNAEAPVQLPEEPVARLKVIHVTENSSTARIVSIKHPILRRGTAVRLARKVP